MNGNQKTIDLSLHMPELSEALDAIVAVITMARQANDRATDAGRRKASKQSRQIGILLDVSRQLRDNAKAVVVTDKAVDVLRESLSIEVRRRKRELLVLANRNARQGIEIGYGAKEALEDALDALVTLDREMLYEQIGLSR